MDYGNKLLLILCAGLQEVEVIVPAQLPVGKLFLELSMNDFISTCSPMSRLKAILRSLLSHEKVPQVFFGY